MIHFTNDELRSMVDMETVNHDLLIEGFRLLNIGRMTIWTTLPKLEEDVRKHCEDNGWDFDTVLVFYNLPPTPEERAAAEEETKRQIEEDPDWDNIQIGYVPDDQVTPAVFPNMTKERFVEILMAPSKLKAFL